MYKLLRQLALKFGYDLVKDKNKDFDAQLNQFLQKNQFDGVIDVGANIGQYAQRLMTAGWHKPIFSFEPNPQVHALLQSKAQNIPAWRVQPAMALGSKTGTAQFQISKESDMSSLLPQTDLLQKISPSSSISRTIDVKVVRLDELAQTFSDCQKLFVKMDVQGFESEVLTGATGLLPKIHGLQLELSLLTMYSGEKLWLPMIEDLATMGFAVHLLFPGYFERKLARQLQVDCIFLRE